MSRSYTSSHPQAPPWRVAGLLYFTLLYLLVFLETSHGRLDIACDTGSSSTLDHVTNDVFILNLTNISNWYLACESSRGIKRFIYKTTRVHKTQFPRKLKRK
jgi:hypothetical protein